MLKYVKAILCGRKQITENCKHILGLILGKLFLMVGAAKYWGSPEIPINRDFKEQDEQASTNNSVDASQSSLWPFFFL